MAKKQKKAKSKKAAKFPRTKVAAAFAAGVPRKTYHLSSKRKS